MYLSQSIWLNDDDDIQVVTGADHPPFLMLMKGDATGGSISISAGGETPADTIQRVIDALTKLRGMVIAQAGGDPVADMGPLEARAMDGDR